MTIWVGADVSKAQVNVAFERTPGRWPFKVFANPPQTAEELIADVRGKLTDPVASLHVVMEATGVDHEPWANALCDAGARVSVANPDPVRPFANGRGFLNKTDGVDAKALARYGPLKPPASWTPPPPEIRVRSALISRLKAVQEDLVRERNRQEQTPRGAAPARVLDALADPLSVLKADIQRLEQAIRDHLAPHPPLKRDQELLRTLPGVGEKTSPQRLALFHRPAFDHARQAAAFVGVGPRHHPSGTSIHRQPSISKAGNPILRQTLSMAAITAKADASLAPFYDGLLAQGKAPLQALVAIMRKLIHLAFGWLKHQTPFNPALVQQNA